MNGIDPTMLHAWLTARSVARGLPAPVPDHGGFRVDTNSEAEVKRWVFPRVSEGLAELGRTIDAPRHLLKLCGSADELTAALPDEWQLLPPAYVMTATRRWIGRTLPAGYALEVSRNGPVVEAQVISSDGAPAAKGYAAEGRDVFIYDRIATAPEHRRKGLGRAVMSALSAARPSSDTPQLLVATEEGRALYTTLGWRVLSPYSTASIASP
jgi:GNAT superfamily N-acetyltransferase